MDKPNIPQEDGRLKKICNDAFFGVKRRLPRRLREFEVYDKYLAFSLGFLAGYSVAEAGERLMESLEMNTENAALIGISATVGTPIISYGIAPRYVRNFVRENPLYARVLLV